LLQSFSSMSTLTDPQTEEMLMHLDPNSSKLWSFVSLKQPLQPLKKEYKLFFAYIIITAISFLVFQLQILPNANNTTISILVNSFFLMSFVFFLCSWLISPGHLKKKADKNSQKMGNFLILLQKFDPQSLCPYCKVVRTPQSKHCYVCEQCVEHFDHHCGWVSNCIGKNNHVTFILFLVAQLALILTSLGVTTMHLEFDIMNFPTLLGHDMEQIVMENLSQDDESLITSADIRYKVFSGAVIMVSLIFVVPVTYLLTIQINSFISKHCGGGQEQIRLAQEQIMCANTKTQSMHNSLAKFNSSRPPLKQFKNSTYYPQNIDFKEGLMEDLETRKELLLPKGLNQEPLMTILERSVEVSHM